MNFPLWKRRKRDQELNEEIQGHFTLGAREEMELGKSRTVISGIGQSFESASLPMYENLRVQDSAFAKMCAFASTDSSLAVRTREFGLGKVLGAETGGILRLAIGQGLALVAAGMIIGLAAAIATARLFAGLLYNTASGEVLSYLGAAGLLVVIGLIASYIPARRAARVDPMEALRYE